MLAKHGEERTAEVGEVLFEVGDEVYPFIAIRAGEAAILDANGHEIVRHGALGFLGEMNLLSGQTVFLTAVVTEPMRYVAVERETLRSLLFEELVHQVGHQAGLGADRFGRVEGVLQAV
ncbi:MAG: hypothetical protein BGO11_20630 [Solirubrobacterales bacterium 70-9]|nr:MAG: hypothetical protein BGO11_20630 [Solirubrobacterales bacterium 70-9]